MSKFDFAMCILGIDTFSPSSQRQRADVIKIQRSKVREISLASIHSCRSMSLSSTKPSLPLSFFCLIYLFHNPPVFSLDDTITETFFKHLLSVLGCRLVPNPRPLALLHPLLDADTRFHPWTDPPAAGETAHTNPKG